MKRGARIRLTVFLIITSLLAGSLTPDQPAIQAHALAAPTGDEAIHIPLVVAPGTPDFTIISPANHATVSGATIIAIQPLDSGAITSVSFQAGASTLEPDSTAGDGFQTIIDASQLPAGPLHLTAIASGPSGKSISKSIDVTVLPHPPASAKVGKSGSILATANGSTIIVPPGAVGGETTISVHDKTQEEVTEDEGIEWDDLGVTFLGAIDIQTSAPISKPLGVTSVGFSSKIQPGQAVVTYRILPDSDGDGIGELTVVNGAQRAPNGTLVSPPVAQAMVSSIQVETNEGDAVSAGANQVTQADLHGPPGTMLALQASGFNPLSAQGNVATFRSVGNGATVRVSTAVEQNSADPADQTVRVLIPFLPPGAATLTLLNQSTGSTAGPFDLTVDQPAPLSQPAISIIDTFLVQAAAFVTALPEEANSPIDHRAEIAAKLSQLRDAFAEISNDPSPEAQQFITQSAIVIQGSGILEGFNHAFAASQLAGSACLTPHDRNLQNLLVGTIGVVTGAACGLFFTGAGLFACVVMVGVAVLYEGFLISETPNCPAQPSPAICIPTATAEGAGTTGMGSAPPPGGDSCGNVGGGPAISVQSASVAENLSGRFLIKIFPQGGGRPLTPFTGATDPGGYFYIPLIPQGEPFHALATDLKTGAAVGVDGVGPATGRSVVLNFDFSNAQQNLYPITIGDTISDGVPSAGAGNIEEQGGLDIYTFHADAGQRVYFDVLDLDINVRWQLLDPSGKSIFSTCLACGDPGAFTLADAGIYTIRVGDDSSDEVGAYQFKLWNVPPSHHFTIHVGDTITNGVPGPGAGNIETPGVLDIYTFEAAAGQRIFVDALDLDVNIRWELLDSAGDSIFSECLACGDPGTFTLADAGTYTLTVGHNIDDSVGTYQFKLWDVPDAQEFAVAIGDTVSDGSPGAGAGNIETPGVLDIYTLAAVAGQRIFLDVLELDVNIRWQMVDSAGTSIFTECLACGDPGAFTLAKSGTYTITVGATTDDSVGAYQFKIWNVPAPHEFAITIGDTISDGVPGPGAGNIESPGVLDIYTFHASAGQRVFFDVLSPSVNVNWEVRGATGGAIFAKCTGCGDPGAFTLAQAGTYTITVGKANSDATGAYQFKLWDVPAPQEFAIAIGDTISDGVPGPGAGNIEIPGSLDIYTFHASAGQKVLFDVLQLDVNVGWELRDPSGATLFAKCLACGDPGVVTLAQSGDYTITVGQANNDAVGAYQFKLTPQ